MSNVTFDWSMYWFYIADQVNVLCKILCFRCVKVESTLEWLHIQNFRLGRYIVTLSSIIRSEIIFYGGSVVLTSRMVSQAEICLCRLAMFSLSLISGILLRNILRMSTNS